MKLIIDMDDEDYKAIAKGYLPYGAIADAIRNGTPLKEWLSSFNTDSAPICINKIQELKRECEKE